MNIGNYIYELLLENEMVIIPGFGAFISNYKPAEINMETDELMPPSKEISFNQQIRNNDGLLVGKIAEGEVISHFDALKEIEKERENIIYQLDKGEKVYLEETGELFINDNNEIQLEPIQSKNLLLDSFGLESVSIEEKEKVVPLENKIEPEKEEPPKKEPNIEHEEKLEPIADKVTDTEENKKRSWLWLLFILAPIIIVGMYISTKKAGEKAPRVKTTDEPTMSIKENPIAGPELTLIDSVPTPSEDSILTDGIKTLPIETIVPSLSKFYLVGGSFKAKENADNYLIQLKAEGFEPFHIGKRGNFYIVGIGTYNTEKEALAAKRDFSKENTRSGIWIYEEQITEKL